MTVTQESIDRTALNEAYLIGRDLGRKFEVRDIQSQSDFLLDRAAEAYIRLYTAPGSDIARFNYLDDMADALSQWGQLTPGQVKGTLNCLMADARKRCEAARMARQSPVSQQSAVSDAGEHTDCASGPMPDGYYTVDFEDGAHRTFRLRTLTEDQSSRYSLPKDGQIAALLIGPMNTLDYAGYAFVVGPQIVRKMRVVKTWDGPEATQDQLSRADEALLTIIGNVARRTEFGLAYAMQSTRCYVCGRDLTTPESIKSGIGPICAGRES